MGGCAAPWGRTYFHAFFMLAAFSVRRQLLPLDGGVRPSEHRLVVGVKGILRLDAVTAGRLSGESLRPDGGESATSSGTRQVNTIEGVFFMLPSVAGRPLLVADDCVVRHHGTEAKAL